MGRFKELQISAMELERVGMNDERAVSCGNCPLNHEGCGAARGCPTAEDVARLLEAQEVAA